MVDALDLDKFYNSPCFSAGSEGFLNVLFCICVEQVIVFVNYKILCANCVSSMLTGTI